MNDTFDNGGEEVEDRPMSALTREEFHAKLETVKVRQDARAASIEARIDGFSDRVDERFARVDDRFVRIDERFVRVDERLDKVDKRFDQVDRRIDQLRTTIILTGVTSVITIVLGMAAFNAALLSNMIAGFDSGRAVARDHAELHRQIEETAVLLRQLQADAPRPERPK